MAETENQPDVAALTVQLLSAYLANNSIASEDLADLIRTTRAALVEDAAPRIAEPEARTYTPAVSARKSLASADHIISLIDGKPYKTLKRHLSANGLTPDQYRQRYGLPASYPMVAPSFTARRREIAERIGLGNRRAVDADVAIQNDETPESISAGANDAAPVKAPRGRPAGKRGSANASTVAAGAAKATRGKPKSSAKADVSEAATKAGPVEVADESITAPGAEVTTTEASPAPAKTSKRPAAKATKAAGKAAAKAKAAAKSSTAGTDELTTGDALAATPKRRGKLGLFGKAAGQSGASMPSEAGATTPQGAAGSDAPLDVAEAEPVAAKKPAPKKRMARAPKSTTPKANAEEAAGE